MTEYQNSGWLSKNIFMMNNNFVQQHFISYYLIIYGYYINNLKYTNNIPAQFFCYYNY